MRLITDEKDPDLIGLIEEEQDVDHIAKIVSNMNRDLIDSGFEQYQFRVETEGPKAYIRRI